MGRLCYGPSLQWADLVMGRVCNGPTLLWAKHPQKWSTDLPGYRIGIPIGIALRKQWTDIAIVISCSFYTIKSLNK